MDPSTLTAFLKKTRWFWNTIFTFQEKILIDDYDGIRHYFRQTEDFTHKNKQPSSHFLIYSTTCWALFSIKNLPIAYENEILGGDYINVRTKRLFKWSNKRSRCKR